MSIIKLHRYPLSGHSHRVENFLSILGLDAELLQAVLPLADYDFYLCGPAGFMQTTYNLLRDLGVNDQRIYAESFGPTSLIRQSDHATEIRTPAREEWNKPAAAGLQR